MNKMMLVVLVGLIGSTAACKGIGDRDHKNVEQAPATSAAPESRPLQLGGGGDQGVHGLKPAIHDGVNGSCAGPVCGGGIKPSPDVWTK